MPKNIKLSQAMNTRLCHDLSGSVGAIDNYLSLLEHKDKAICKKAKKLALEESSNLMSKIKFFRSAYGISDGEDSMSLINMAKLLIDFFDNTQVQLNLHFETGLLYMEAHLAKSAICLTAIASENISYSGVIDFYLYKDQDSPVRIFAKGDNITLKDEHLKVLQGESRKTINVSNCREHYINKMCVKKGYKVLA
jgi:histidine phosphotransferase ChpT